MNNNQATSKQWYTHCIITCLDLFYITLTFSSKIDFINLQLSKGYLKEILVCMRNLSKDTARNWTHFPPSLKEGKKTMADHIFINTLQCRSYHWRQNGRQKSYMKWFVLYKISQLFIGEILKILLNSQYWSFRSYN